MAHCLKCGVCPISAGGFQAADDLTHRSGREAIIDAGAVIGQGEGRQRLIEGGKRGNPIAGQGGG